VYELNPVYPPQLKSAWFQPSNLSNEDPVSKFAFKCNLYRYDAAAFVDKVRRRERGDAAFQGNFWSDDADDDDDRNLTTAAAAKVNEIVAPYGLGVLAGKSTEGGVLGTVSSSVFRRLEAALESVAKTSLTLDEWLVKTYGAAFSLHVLQLPNFCSARCCQLFHGQDIGDKQEMACYQATGTAEDDLIAKHACLAAVEDHRAAESRARGKGGDPGGGD
jgi:hypothetical protein